MSQRPASWADAKARIAATPRRDFAACFRLAGLDPVRDARFADWADVDFEGSNLAGFDFTGAKLYRAKFKGAKIVGARFDQAILDCVNHDRRTRDTRDANAGPHAPAHLEGAARLRDADDWNHYVDPKSWRLADRPPNDDYLFTGAIFQDAPFAPEMVVVPSGTYLQGDELKPVDGINRREVYIAHRLAVGRFPVTFEEWAACYDDGGTKYKPQSNRSRGRLPSRLPVTKVNWFHITRDYLPWLNRRLGLSGPSMYRLLSEAEWEYSCRAGTNTRYSFGDTLNPRQAQFSVIAVGDARQTVEVGSFPSNAWGLYDMHGNVWEWCQDEYTHAHISMSRSDGMAYETVPGPGAVGVAQVLRGGSWYNHRIDLRSADRLKSERDSLLRYFGFRLARTLSV
jgi:formylglycine-generating enzyme required for sulfatase activity